MGFDRLLNIMALGFSYYKLTVVLVASITFLAMMFIPDSDPRAKLSTFEEGQRAAVQKQYEQELFTLVKAPNVDYTLIDKLLAAGVSVDCRDEQGRTPLFYAVATRNQRLYRHLVWKNADATVKDDLGISLLDLLDKTLDRDFYYAIQDDTLRRELHNRGLKVTGTSRSFDKNGNLQQSKIHVRETESWTPLMLAIKEFDTAAFARLVRVPGAIELETFNGSTPLFFAIKFRNYEAMNELIGRGADLEHRNSNQVSVLGFAIEYGTFEAVKTLVDAGADTRAICDDGLNAYRLALAYSKDEMADYIRNRR
jgi:ankyrin repeat protein